MSVSRTKLLMLPAIGVLLISQVSAILFFGPATRIEITREKIHSPIISDNSVSEYGSVSEENAATGASGSPTIRRERGGSPASTVPAPSAPKLSLPPAMVSSNWPAIESATIRPGVGITIVDHGSCTTNFVFLGSGSRLGKLYIGTAAHCVDQDIGAQVRLGGSRGPVIGTVVYSAWKELNIVSVSCFVVLSCYSDDPNTGNDFALIEINDASRAKVHPAVIRFGGPTGLASYPSVVQGDRILTFGATSLRPGPAEIDAREGYIIGKDEPWRYSSYIVTPGLPGDSGSNVLLASGQALGILVTLNDVPPAANGITALDRVLEFALSRGWELELQTWPLLYGGILPNPN